MRNLSSTRSGESDRTSCKRPDSGKGNRTLGHSGDLKMSSLNPVVSESAGKRPIRGKECSDLKWHCKTMWRRSSMKAKQTSSSRRLSTYMTRKKRRILTVYRNSKTFPPTLHF